MVAREIRETAKWAQECGWTVTEASSGHTRFFKPTGEYVVDYPSTASSQTRLRNTEAALRRAGLELPPPPSSIRRVRRNQQEEGQ